MSVAIEINDTRLKEAMRTASFKVKDGIKDWVKETAIQTEREAKKQAPVRHGILQSSIHTLIGSTVAIVKPTVNYAKYVIQGTGLYGPERRPIVAKTGGFLRFKIGDTVFYRRSVKGQHPNAFLNRTYDLISPKAQRNARLMLDEVVDRI